MAVSYKKLFHLLIDKDMTNARLQQEAGFSANIITRLKRGGYISLESVESICRVLNCGVDEIPKRNRSVTSCTVPCELFCNVRANAANDGNLNETLERVFRHIEESAKGSEAESDFAGLFDDYDVNSNKLGSTVAKRNEKLVKLLNGVGEMNLGNVKDHSIDAFSDAYEHLMTMYASNAGKSGGEFFTPADVSELLTRLGTVGKTEINKVYDIKTTRLIRKQGQSLKCA